MRFLVGLGGILAVLCVLSSFSSVVQAKPRPAGYVTTNLGTFAGESLAQDISETGVVVGTSYLESGDPRAFVWTQRNGMENLGTLGGLWSVGLLVSDNGRWVSGISLTVEGLQHTFAWSRETGMIDIDTTEWSSIPRGINDEGMVVGSTVRQDPFTVEGFFWTPINGKVSLFPMTSAQGVNNEGFVVGMVDASPTRLRAAAWTSDKGVIDLDPTDRWDHSVALAVNDDGVIVGGGIRCDDYDAGIGCTGGAARWSRFGRIRLVETLQLGDSLFTWASQVNKNGLAVGRLSHLDTGKATAFVWRRNGRWADVGIFGGPETESLDINADGVVVGGGRIAGEVGEAHPFVWTRGEGITDIAPRGTRGSALAINDTGAIVGQVCTDALPRVCQAILWRPRK